jgi:hypothetical protein
MALPIEGEVTKTTTDTAAEVTEQEKQDLWIGILTPFLCLWQEFNGQNELKPNWGMDIGIGGRQ